MAALIHEQMTKVSVAIGAIGKTRENTQQGFRFRGIDEFLDTAHPVFGAHGVSVVPTVLSREVFHHPRDKGFWTQVFLTVRYDFYAADGSSISAAAAGEGLDLADKATNKAMSSAFKYVLMQALCIPLRDMADSDADPNDSTTGATTTHQRARSAARAPRAQRQQGQPASAADLRALIDTLSGVPDHVQDQMRAWCKAEHIVLKRATSAQHDAALAELARLSASA